MLGAIQFPMWWGFLGRKDEEAMARKTHITQQMGLLKMRYGVKSYVCGVSAAGILIASRRFPLTCSILFPVAFTGALAYYDLHVISANTERIFRRGIEQCAQNTEEELVQQAFANTIVAQRLFDSMTVDALRERRQEQSEDPN